MKTLTHPNPIAIMLVL